MTKSKLEFDFSEYPAFISYTPHGDEIAFYLFAGIAGIMKSYVDYLGYLKVVQGDEGQRLFKVGETIYPTLEEGAMAVYEAWRQPKTKKKGKQG